MSAPFARLQARLNAATRKHLSNAIAMVGGVEVPVIFDKPFAAPFGGEADATAPECIGADADLGALQRGDSLSINGVAYQILTAEPDGSGLVRLVLGTA